MIQHYNSSETRYKLTINFYRHSLSCIIINISKTHDTCYFCCLGKTHYTCYCCLGVTQRTPFCERFVKLLFLVHTYTHVPGFLNLST